MLDSLRQRMHSWDGGILLFTQQTQHQQLILAHPAISTNVALPTLTLLKALTTNNIADPACSRYISAT
jgi:hypothetical protein